MECVDEDLAPSQKEAECKAQTEYQSAVECVEYAKSTTDSKMPRRGRPPAAGSGSSRKGRGRGTGAVTDMTVEPGELTRCTQLIANSSKLIVVV